MTDGTPAYWWDGSHVMIVGATGAGSDKGGKTATAHYWATAALDHGFDYAIAYAPKGGGYAFPAVRDARAAATAIADGLPAVMWVPRDAAEPADEHADVVAFAEGLDGDVLLVHDDAVMYDEADSLKRSTALLGNPADEDDDRVKSIVATQDPWDMPRKGVRSNVDVVAWVGPLTDAGRSWLRQRGTGEDRIDAIEEHGRTPHAWSVLNADDLDRYPPVPEAFAE
jgi:hypothetical protein